VVFVDKMKKLPDSEFEIMKAVWASEAPVTIGIVMDRLGNSWKRRPQSAVSLLLRLAEQGFLRTENSGKERTYFPLVSKEEYLQFETDKFAKQFHESPFLNLINTVYGNKALSAEDADELCMLAKEKRG
jgi:predicted transcriptional regulator